MRSRNFYIVLGISPQADQETIRSAYRALAKRCHPDHMGPSGASRFHEIAEAYRVLSDPESRRTYNRELDLASVGGHSPEPLAYPNPTSAPEPLIAEPLSLRHKFHIDHPSVEDEFLEWTMRHFMGQQISKSGRLRPISVNVVLSREEAKDGCTLPIQLPSFSPCPACDGSGRDWFSLCPRCGGDGTAGGNLEVRLRIPPMVVDGTVWEIPVLAVGLDLRVQIRIDPLVRY